MTAQPEIAFAASPPDAAGPFEVRVNFGVFAGRDATAAELDELGRRLVPEIGAVSIVSEERHEVGSGAEAVLHQVRIQLDPEQLPRDVAAADRLKNRLVEVADEWARSCDAERHAPESEL